MSSTYQEPELVEILTLHLDTASQAHFEGMRRQYFPPERNLIPAHLTLFHKLPAGEETVALLEEAALREGFPLRVTGLRSLGRGVAYTLASEGLMELHRGLSAALRSHLSPQDRQSFQPHVVIQNKATPESARELLARLRPGFEPFDVVAEGLDLWHYRGGPWEFVRTFGFTREGGV